MLIARPKPGGDTEALIEQLGLRDRIRFVTDASHEQINRLYAESAVAVVPSLYEGFGLPAVEAMAAGIPLVSTDGGALKEVVGEGGLQVPAGDMPRWPTPCNMFSAIRNWRTHWLSEGWRARGSSSAGRCVRARWRICIARVSPHVNGRSRQARSRTRADLPRCRLR